jgi:hypothetical protein
VVSSGGVNTLVHVHGDAPMRSICRSAVVETRSEMLRLRASLQRALRWTLGSHTRFTLRAAESEGAVAREGLGTSSRRDARDTRGPHNALALRGADVIARQPRLARVEPTLRALEKVYVDHRGGREGSAAEERRRK